MLKIKHGIYFFMNKKIYFNDKFLLFSEAQPQVSRNQVIRKYDAAADKNNAFIEEILSDFLEFLNNRSFILQDYKLEDLIRYFKKEHYYIEAAGGFIEKQNEFLFIHRHGRWDLPKGKLEKNEGIREAAIRECEEECGIRELEIVRQLSSTFHIYPYKKSYALKQSYWFYMTSSYSQALVPQAEEDIDQVKWFTQQQIQSVIIKDTYYTITDVIREALSISA